MSESPELGDGVTAVRTHHPLLGVEAGGGDCPWGSPGPRAWLRDPYHACNGLSATTEESKTQNRAGSRKESLSFLLQPCSLPSGLGYIG